MLLPSAQSDFMISLCSLYPGLGSGAAVGFSVVVVPRVKPRKKRVGERRKLRAGGGSLRFSYLRRRIEIHNSRFTWSTRIILALFWLVPWLKGERAAQLISPNRGVFAMA